MKTETKPELIAVEHQAPSEPFKEFIFWGIVVPVLTPIVIGLSLLISFVVKHLLAWL